MSLFEEQEHLDLEVTHTGDAEHGNSGESATINNKKQPSLNIEVMRSGDIKFGNSGESRTVTNGPAGEFQGGKVEQDREKGIVRLSQE